MNIEIKNRTNKHVIFSHYCEKNTIKKTVEEAVKLKINLSEADLKGADLDSAKLGGADLSHADLRKADLKYADLNDANLNEANLRCAELSWADLRWANLRWAELNGTNLKWAELRGAIGNNKEIITIQTGIYTCVITELSLTIGCESHTFDEWIAFTDSEIDKMDAKKSLSFWHDWKTIILKSYELNFKK